MKTLMEYLNQAVKLGVSDIFMVPGAPVTCKQEGLLTPMDEHRLMPDASEMLISGIYEMAQRDMTAYRKTGDDDFSFSVPGLARFRVNAYRQRGSLAAVIRVVAFC